MNAEEFRTRLLALPAPLDGGFWGDKRRALREHAEAGHGLERFLHWPTVVTTMFVGNAPYSRGELAELAADPGWDRWRAAIQEDGLGEPPTINDYTSGNLVHQAYHLLQWEHETGRQVQDLETILEIGAGYGALAKIIRRLGFAGRYQIVDFPELALLQQWYLGDLGIPAEWPAWPPAEVLEPDLVVALWSLSEMDVPTQLSYVSFLRPRHWLIAGLDSLWEGQDNRLLFRGLERFLARRDIAHLPGNYYLLG